MYNKPVLNNHLNNIVPSMIKMRKKLAQHNHDFIMYRSDEGKHIAQVYIDGVFSREIKLEYKNKDVCMYKTLIIIYKNIIG